MLALGVGCSPIFIGGVNADTPAGAPTLTKTSTSGANPLTWSASYPSAVVFDGTDGTKVDMQWRVNGGSWNADTRQALTSDVLINGSFTWPLFSATAFSAGDFVEAQEREVPYVAGVAGTPSGWSNTVSDTMATSTIVLPSAITGIKDYYQVHTAKLFQDTAGTVAVTTDGDPVGRWNSEMGVMAPFTQATSTKRPLYRANSGNPYLDFDGVDDRMTAGTTGISALAQPYYWIVACKLDVLGGNHIVVDGATTTNRSVLNQNNIGSEQWELFAGAFVGNQGLTPTTNDCVYGGLFNGASSKGRLDQTDGTTVSIGTTAPIDGLSLASKFDGSANWLDGRIYGLALIAASPSAGDKTSLSTWAGSLQGRSI